jgi:hypothetical protein
MADRARRTSRVAYPASGIESRILVLRGQRVMIDADLAALYGVPTKRINGQVRRNARRFPEDFCFRLPATEMDDLRSQIATSNVGRGGRRNLPYAFTGHGAIMAANVLNSPRAVEMNVHGVRAFVRLREVIASHKELVRRVDEPEGCHDEQFEVVFDAIRRPMAPPEAKPKRRIGFV